MAWEAHAAAVVNAETPEALAAALRAALAAGGSSHGGASRSAPLPGAPPAAVFLARDTRPSGPALAAAAAAGAAALGAAVFDLGASCASLACSLLPLLTLFHPTHPGELTTPQLHYAVYRAWHAAAAVAASGTAPTGDDAAALAPTAASAAAAHVERLARGYAAMVAPCAAADVATALQLDCACGIGAAPAAALAAHPVAAAAGLRLELRNAGREPGALNARCGADFVQKARTAPIAFGDSAGTSRYAAALDGDADRVVFFATADDGSAGGGAAAGGTRLARLLDGDKTAALVAQHVATLAAAAGLPLRLGVVQTAYANGGSAAFLRSLGAAGCAPPALRCDVLRTPTGVKHLHAAAERYDVGIYWESNGHGAALFSDAARAAIAAKAATGCAAARALDALALASNPAVGDGLSGALIVDAVLRLKRWGLAEWDSLYDELPSRQLAVRVADRAAVRTAPGDETRAAAPPGLQAAVEAAVAAAGGEGSSARAFARASGTEDVVRIYAEAATQRGADALAAQVARAVLALAAGVGAPPPPMPE